MNDDKSLLNFDLAVLAIQRALHCDDRKARSTLANAARTGDILATADRYGVRPDDPFHQWDWATARYDKNTIDQYTKAILQYAGENVDSRSSLQDAEKNKGGSPRRYNWDVAGAAFGAWLHDQPSILDMPQPEKRKKVDAVLAELGFMTIPDPKTVDRYIEMWIKGYRVYEKLGAEEDARLNRVSPGCSGDGERRSR
jgi:hypothetical protein